jgi:hypothetical protein
LEEEEEEEGDEDDREKPLYNIPLIHDLVGLE